MARNASDACTRLTPIVRVDAGIRATPSRHILECLDNIALVFVIEHLGMTLLLGHLQTFRDTVYSNDALCSQQIRTL